jgi:hypothetical protein
MARRTFGPLYKQPNELFPISIDFADDLESTEEVSSASIIAYDVDDTDVSSTILSGSSSISDGENQDETTHTNSKVTQKVQAGTSRAKYKITFRATTSNGNVYEADVKWLVVREL